METVYNSSQTEKAKIRNTFLNLLIILLLVLFSGAALFAQDTTYVTVPDTNFRKALISLPYYEITQVPNSNQVKVPNIGNILTIAVDSSNISDMTGIEAFTNLTELNCTFNNIQTLDLRNNKELRHLFSYHNQLTDINLTGCPKLNTLMTGYNLFTSLDLSQNTELATLYFHYALNITSIDLSKNTKLQTLVVDNTNLTYLDLENNINLEELECWKCNLPSLDLRSNIKLKVLACYTSNIKKLLLPPLQSLTRIHCEGNDIKYIDLHESSGIRYINTTNNPKLQAVYFSTLPADTVEVHKDDATMFVQIAGADQNPSVKAGTTGTYILFRTGAVLEETTPSTTDGTLTVTTAADPSTFGDLPSTIESLNMQKYWTITNDGLSGIAYSLVFDLSLLSSTIDFDKVRILKRDNAYSPWVDLSENQALTYTLLYPYVKVSGLTSFSEFAVGIAKDGAMPVELTSFTASQFGSQIKLSWTTATEKNSHSYEIERRFGNSKQWTKIGEVAAAGNSNSEKQYSFADNATVSGAQYGYRLKQIDNDGKYQYSDAVEILASKKEKLDFALLANYPNPFNPVTTISYTLPETSVISLKVYDILGQEIATLINGKQEPGMHQTQFDATNLSSGIYFYKITAPGLCKTNKMLLVK
jgi:hypothetical protein